MLVNRIGFFLNMFMYNDSIALQNKKKKIVTARKKKIFFVETECTCRQKKQNQPVKDLINRFSMFFSFFSKSKYHHILFNNGGRLKIISINIISLNYSSIDLMI
jgi:hypothetical protein